MKRLCLLVFILTGCTTSSVLLEKSGIRHKDDSTNRAERVPPVVGPAWFQLGAAAGKAQSLWEALELSAVGENEAIVLTTLGYVAVDREEGLIGQLNALAATDHVQLGRGDKVFVMQANGQLARYTETSHLFSEDAEPGQTLGHWRSWRAFDAAPGCLAISVGDTVNISSDEGDSFFASRPASRRLVNNVWCRSDGLVVAEVTLKEGVEFHTTRNGGRTWKQLPSGPRRLFRDGNLLWGKDRKCPHVVSLHGDSWIKTADSRLPQRQSWLRFISLERSGEHHDSALPYNSANQSLVADRTLKAATCENESSKGGPASTKSNTLDRPANDCAGLACLWRLRPKPLTGLRFMAALAAKVRGSELPSIIIANSDERRITVQPAPAGCRPQSVVQGPGIMVLGCATAHGLALYTSHDGSDWGIEGELANVRMGIPRLDWADDGTLLLGGLCPLKLTNSDEATASCNTVALRNPKDLGEEGLWTVLPDNSTFIAHRAMRHGQALIVRRDGWPSDEIKLMTFQGDIGISPMCTLPAKVGRLRNLRVDSWNVMVELTTGHGTQRAKIELEAAMPGHGDCQLH